MGNDKVCNMKLRMNAQDGHITGMGRDDEGTFTMKGTYDSSTKLCRFVKYYIGKHQIMYQGHLKNEVQQCITGIWKGNVGSGTFELKKGFHSSSRNLPQNKYTTNENQFFRMDQPNNSNDITEDQYFGVPSFGVPAQNNVYYNNYFEYPDEDIRRPNVQ